MTIRIRILALTLALLAPAARAEDATLFTATGAWQGEGRIAPSATAPLERGRCRVDVSQSADATQADVIGKCVVAGGASNVSMRFVKGAGTSVRAGVWSAATDKTVQFAGRSDATGLAMTSLEPIEVDGVTYEARVDVDFTGNDAFTLKQILREPGDDGWRLIVDMSFSQN
ncbi:hypothetical protein [Aliiroseovarius subalbicans]|uniref:hypothetical protein n=1 Tax=Aliiroseovarius subalbicans TaxID=2925840 RepID=UPI001F565B33|nr:hypothetical protein [Aliiroseovarius subalbicans]MCI2398943.1 hypothetical protein [Aliiroseovarius subalbicans]